MSEAHPVDVHVGTIIRNRRKQLKMSQQDLANAIGVTFQQVQKYERGSNRISASKLYQASQVLNMPVAHAFEGLDLQSKAAFSDTENTVSVFLISAEGVEMAKYFAKLSPIRRRGVLTLVKSILAEDDK